MAATVPVFLKHTHINKATQEQPYTARAHSRYTQRQSATHSCHVYLMPESYQARQRWFFDHENGLRKNGRVIDKFTITIPYDIQPEDAASALDRFGKRIGLGRCPFMFTIQGVHTRNYHAHYIFIDRDFETGRRVYGTSEYNSSRGIKLDWEASANEVFAELGYDVRVKVHEWTPELDAANDNKIEAAPDNAFEPSEQPLEAVPDADTVDAPEPEDNMAEAAYVTKDDAEREYEGTPHGFHIKEIFSTVTELNRKHDAETRLAEAERKYQRARQDRENASLAESAHLIHVQKLRQNAHQAEQDLSDHITRSGKMKGFGLSVFGFTLKTPGRKKAEAAKQKVESASFTAEYQASRHDEYKHDTQVAETKEQEAEREALLRRNELVDLYGDAKDLAETEITLNNTVKKHLHAMNALHEGKGVTVEEAAEALFYDEITYDEFRTYLIASGQEALLSAYEEGIKPSKEQDEGLEED